MKHSIRLSRIQESKRAAPKGMRKIVVDDKIYFYRVSHYGLNVIILDDDRNRFKEINSASDRTWWPRDIEQEIRSAL